MKTLRLNLPVVTKDSFSRLAWIKPVLTPALVLLIVGMSICIPSSAFHTLMNVDTDRDASQLDAAPTGKNLIGRPYPGQVQNYRDQISQLCGGEVLLQPSHGIPNSVTIVVDTPLRPSLQEEDTKKAWLDLAEMRRCYYDPETADRCDVQMTDGHGRLFADVNEDTIRARMHTSGNLRLAFLQN